MARRQQLDGGLPAVGRHQHQLRAARSGWKRSDPRGATLKLHGEPQVHPERGNQNWCRSDFYNHDPRACQLPARIAYRKERCGVQRRRHAGRVRLLCRGERFARCYRPRLPTELLAGRELLASAVAERSAFRARGTRAVWQGCGEGGRGGDGSGETVAIPS